MSRKEIIVNASMAEEVRIAIVESGKLVDLDIETSVKAKHKGNIYKGIISNIEDGLDAAFVDIGEERQAFLPLSEIRPNIFPPELVGKKKVKVSDVLARGQEIIVQVTKDEMGSKGAAVSTYLSLPGRFVVLMHSDESGGGISRKIDSEQARSAAREMLSRLNVPENMAVIIRTAGMNCTKSELFKDFKALCETWQQIDKGAQIGRAPTLLYREPDIVVRTIRDYFSPDVASIVIDDENEYEDAVNYFRESMPDCLPLLEKFKKKEPIFQYYGIEKSISELFDLEVKLPSGGYVTIEQTEALVAIDVNSGSSTKEEDHEATVYKTNLEAADEIARQLRLRDMGGIIVIDFIDMVSRWHRRDVERKLRDLMKHDKARVKLGVISENGTLELTRQRIRQSHSLTSRVVCPNCSGTGRIRDAQGLALAAIRKITGYLAKKRSPLSKLVVNLPIEVANFLNNRKRKELMALCESFATQVDIIGDINLIDSQLDFKEEKRGYAGLNIKPLGRDYWPKKPDAPKNKDQRATDASAPKRELPAPSIGPAPVFIEAEEDEGDGKELVCGSNDFGFEEDYSDELSKALFAQAPSDTIQKLLEKYFPKSALLDNNLNNVALNEEAEEKNQDSIGNVEISRNNMAELSSNEPKAEENKKRFNAKRRNFGRYKKYYKNPNKFLKDAPLKKDKSESINE